MTLLQKIRKTLTVTYESIMIDYCEYRIARLKEKINEHEIKRNAIFGSHIINRSVEVWNRINSDTKQDVV